MYLLDFWEENLPNQISDFFTNVKNYLVSVGLTIYDNLVSIMGETPAKMTIMVAVIAIILFVLLKIIYLFKEVSSSLNNFFISLLFILYPKKFDCFLRKSFKS